MDEEKHIKTVWTHENAKRSGSPGEFINTVQASKWDTALSTLDGCVTVLRWMLRRIYGNWKFTESLWKQEDRQLFFYKCLHRDPWRVTALEVKQELSSVQNPYSITPLFAAVIFSYFQLSSTTTFSILDILQFPFTFCNLHLNQLHIKYWQFQSFHATHSAPSLGALTFHLH